MQMENKPPRLNPEKLESIDHAGLLLKRYVPHANDSNNKNLRHDFERAQKAMQRVCFLYKEAFDRRTPKQHTEVYTASTLPYSRLIVGLGTASVWETGLTLHHTYGTPIIPGSALKGMCAHHAQEVFFEPDKDNTKKLSAKTEFFTYEQYCFLFGDETQAGHLIFHDAWIYPESLKTALCPDVITPHHHEYYSSQGGQAPTDFDSPVPVPFVSVCGKFQVLLTCDGVSSDEEYLQWMTLMKHLLGDALEHRGIGGKTSSGYGRMKLPGS